jgi:hypothetical protein
VATAVPPRPDNTTRHHCITPCPYTDKILSITTRQQRRRRFITIKILTITIICITYISIKVSHHFSSPL